MNTDDLKLLSRHADEVRGREPSRLAEVHGRVRAIRRRRVMTTTAAGAVLTLSVCVGVLAPRLFAHTPPPAKPPTPVAPTPTQTVTPDKTPPTDGLFHPRKGTKRLTLRQTVLSYNAEQLSGVTSPGDPDVRLSIWHTRCMACPIRGEARFHPDFYAMALTQDGYETTSYLRLPTGDQYDPPSISSPVPGVFLLVEHLNGPAWVLHANGDLQPLRRVADTARITDRRLVYKCTDENEVNFANGWCLLDPRHATFAQIRGTSIELGSSAGDPGLGQEPWGMVNTTTHGPGDSAWWQDHGVRRTQELTLHLRRGLIRSLSGNDVPTYWTSRPKSRSMQIRVVRYRSGGLVSLGSRPFPRFPRPGHGSSLEDIWYPGFFRTPGGALLAVSHSFDAPGLMVWRAPSLTAGAFELVYDGRVGPSSARLATEWDYVPTVRGGELHLGLLASDDDGRTWADPVTVWR